MAGLLVAMGIPQYDPNEWRLFIDSFGAIPIGHFVCLKKKHEHIKVVLDLLKYDDHNVYYVWILKW